MTLRSWNTREALEPEFERAWRARLARCPHGNFTLDPEFLRWEAARGRHAMALLIDEPSRAGAIVMRREGDRWISGWPWRSQAVAEDRAREFAAGLSAEDCAWLFEHASRLAAGDRLSCFLPQSRGDGEPGYEAGITFSNSLARDEAELLRGLDETKRRVMRRAVREGYEVVEATTHEQFRAFAGLQAETESRRGARIEGPGDESPKPGEGWREWESPWMWLLVAVKQGRVEAGSGFGLLPGATVDYRTNASSLQGKKEGANILLGYEGLRRARARGLCWLNWGGATQFKRQMGGEPVTMTCWLGGGAAWGLHHQIVATLHRTRPRVAAWWRNLKARGKEQRG